MPRLLLLGGGHAQLAVLRALASRAGRAAAQGWQVTLVTPQPAMLYSGMLPGWIAGHYRLDEIAIDLRALAAAAGCELHSSMAVALDAARRVVRLGDGGALAYERLVLDIGSAVAMDSLGAPADALPRDAALLPVRPIDAFAQGWQRIVANVDARQASSARREGFRVAVLGAGAGGVELAFAARHRLGCAVTLIAGETGLLPNHAPAVRRLAARWLQRRGIVPLDGPASIEPGAPPRLRLPDGRMLRPDAVLIATGSRPAHWLSDSSLALAATGQVLVDDAQRSVSHADVFAVGDVCQRADGALSPSGVHAVRAGPVLAHNLLASLREGDAALSFRRWTPRAASLYLITTGPRHAIVSYGRLAAAGAWAWRWKDRIDRAFIARHRQPAGPQA